MTRSTSPRPTVNPFAERRRFAPVLAKPALALSALLGAAACVSPEQYDEAVTTADLYMRSYHDAQARLTELEAENQALKKELELTGGAVEATAYISDIDRRIEDLDSLLSGLGQAPGDITVRPVEGGVAYDVKDSVLFDSGSAEVRPGGRELIAKLGQDIGQRPIGGIWVRGHTDADPVRHPETRRRFPHGNLQLSAARAIEVAALLMEMGGLPEEKLRIAGLGSTNPVAPNDTPANKQLNRRVEIVVLDEASSSASAALGG